MYAKFLLPKTNCRTSLQTNSQSMKTEFLGYGFLKSPIFELDKGRGESCQEKIGVNNAQNLESEK
jgi:hypothetical protein